MSWQYHTDVIVLLQATAELVKKLDSELRDDAAGAVRVLASDEATYGELYCKQQLCQAAEQPCIPAVAVVMGGSAARKLKFTSTQEADMRKLRGKLWAGAYPNEEQLGTCVAAFACHEIDRLKANLERQARACAGLAIMHKDNA